MEEKRLPVTPLTMENATFILQADLAWPLMCDPTARVISWASLSLADRGLVTVKYAVSPPSIKSGIIGQLHTQKIVLQANNTKQWKRLIDSG